MKAEPVSASGAAGAAGSCQVGGAALGDQTEEFGWCLRACPPAVVFKPLQGDNAAEGP